MELCPPSASELLEGEEEEGKKGSRDARARGRRETGGGGEEKLIKRVFKLQK